jgi:hypothetical protein
MCQCSDFLPEVSAFTAVGHRTEGQFSQGTLKQDGAPDVTRWPPDTLSIRQATFQLHNTQTKGKVRAKTRDSFQLAVLKRLALKFENFTKNIIRELGLNFWQTYCCLSYKQSTLLPPLCWQIRLKCAAIRLSV